MAGFSHAVYIDESGIGATMHHVNRLWVSVAVAIPFDLKGQLDSGLTNLRQAHCVPGVKELKGSGLPHDLLPHSSIASIANGLAALLATVQAHVWVVASHGGVNAPPNFPVQNPRAKDIVRQLLLDRVNGFLVAGYCAPDDFLLIWDITDQQELADFSRSVATFKNSFTGAALSPRLAPAVLGGLSHDWSGLQAADMIANFALHKRGIDLNLPGATAAKRQAFDAYFYPALQRDLTGKVVGWKTW